MRLAQDGPFRASDATALGIPRTYLRRWLQGGIIERLGYGLYRFVEAEPSELATLAAVARRAPRVNICLLSALQFHGLTSEVPFAVWIMVEDRQRAPRFDFVETQVVRASRDAFHGGVDEWEIDGTSVRITTPAKTVADCFRYRRYVGMEVAYTALRDYLREEHRHRNEDYTLESLIEAARIDRVYNGMRPALEALLS